MCQSHKPELDLDFGVGLQFEALEAVILFDITKDRLWLYRTSASVIKPTLACEQILCSGLVFIRLMIDIDFSVRGLSLVAHPPQRAPFTGFRTVRIYDLDGKLVSGSPVPMEQNQLERFQIPVGTYNVEYQIQDGDTQEVLGDYIIREVEINTAETTKVSTLDGRKVI